MASKFVLVCTTNQDGASTAAEMGAGVAGSFITAGAGSSEAIRAIADFIMDQLVGGGIRIDYTDTAVSASTTGTFTGAPSNSETMVINGVTFTAVTSGATGNQFNIGADVTTTAGNLVTAINASTTAGIINTVSASNVAGVVTFSSVVPGSVGLNIPITEALSNFTLAATTFSTGGTQAHNATYAVGVA